MAVACARQTWPLAGDALWFADMTTREKSAFALFGPGECFNFDSVHGCQNSVNDRVMRATVATCSAHALVDGYGDVCKGVFLYFVVAVSSES